MRSYFKIPILDLTNEIVRASTTADPYKAPRSIDGKFVYLEYDEDNIPVDIFKMGIAPKTKAEAKTDLDSADWDQESNTSTLIKNKVVSLDELSSEFKGQGVLATVPKGSTYDIDVKVPFDIYFNGAQIILDKHILGDKATMQVVDKDQVYYPTETVLKEFATDWYFASDKKGQDEVVLNYKARVVKDLYFRLRFTSTGNTDDVLVAINFYFHRIL